MKSYLSYFNEQSVNDAEDLAVARSGFSNGRNQRFIEQLDSDTRTSNRTKNKSDDLIDLIITQQPYEEVMARAMNNVRDAEDAVNKVLELAAARLALSQSELDALHLLAAELPDGTKVAQDQNGEFRNIETGTIIEPERAASIEWRGNEPSFEEIDVVRERADADMELLDGARQDETRLGEIRDELDDKPPADRVQALSEEAEAIGARNEAYLADQPKYNSNNQQFDLSASEISVPSL